MTKNIVIIGSGFAGLMAALSASRLRHEKGVSPADMTITVVSPEPQLVVRPRLYERNPDEMTAPLSDLFTVTDIVFYQGMAEGVDAETSTVTVLNADGATSMLPYDRLVVAAGSLGFMPPIEGLAEYGFAATDLPHAMALDKHLLSLGSRTASPARNTVVVGGAGFTGLEVATEMPGRLREILGDDADIQVIIVDRSQHVAPAMGMEALPYIEDRLADLGIETRLNVSIAAIDEGSVILSDGERIETSTVIWSAGLRAAPITSQIPGEFDNLGRIIVAPDLRVPEAPSIFATGDTAKAKTDPEGNFTAMSCQHARRLGSFAGHNAAADLLGEPALAYDQPAYVTCLDLGPDTAIFTRGWEGKVEITGKDVKHVKKEINEVWIYPPAVDRLAAYTNALEARTVDF